MKRLNLVFFGLILLLATSCGNSFLSKFSTKDTVDITITLPLDALNSNRSARDVTDPAPNELAVSLHVDNQSIIEKSITDFSKSKITVTFPDIPIGATVKADAYLLYNSQEYFGESQEVTVSKNGATLSLTLKKKANGKYPLTVTPTEKGNVITISNLPIGGKVWIYDQDYSVFACDNITQNSYTFTDSYVAKDQEREYHAIINWEEETSPVKVTSIGGEHPFVLTTEIKSDGISLTSPYNIVRVSRIQESSNNAKCTAEFDFYTENLKTYKDELVTDGTTYKYLVVTNRVELDNRCSYFPHSDAYYLKAAGGLGEPRLQNSDTVAATIDYDYKNVEFSVMPEVNLPRTKTFQNATIQFQYNVPDTNYQYSLNCLLDPQCNTYSLIYCFENEQYKGKTLTLDSTSYGLTFEENRSSYRFFFENQNLNLRGMPKTIEVPAQNSSQEISIYYEAALEATDQGVKITLTDLPVGRPLEIYTVKTIGNDNFQNMIFKGTINNETIVLIDKYVEPNETIDYTIEVSYSKDHNIVESRRVTTTAGSGRYKILAENVSEGVKLSIQNPSQSPYILDSIIRVQYKQENIYSSAVYSFNNTEIQSTFSLTDKLVNPGEEYIYLPYLTAGNESFDSIEYTPQPDIIAVTPTNGYGDFSLTNEPEGSITFTASNNYEDYMLGKLTYTTAPAFNTTLTNLDSLNFSSLYLLLSYYDSVKNRYPGIFYSLIPAMDVTASEFEYEKGSTITQNDRSYNNKYEIGVDSYPYQDGETSHVAGFYVEYYNSDKLSKMPQQIVIPSEASPSPDIDNDAACLLYYDDILIGGGEENSYDYSTMLQMITFFGCGETDYTITTTTQNSATIAVITLNDSGFDKMLTYMSQPENPGDPSISIVAIAAFDNKQVAFLTEDDFEELSSILESNEYTFTNNNKVVRLELSAFKKMMTDGYDVSSALLVIPYLNANETLKIQDSIDEYSFRKLAAALKTVNSSVTITLDLSSADFDTVPKNAFSTIKALKYVNLPSMVTEINDSAFMGCSNLVRIDLPENLTRIGSYSFSNCLALASITIPETVQEIGDDAFGSTGLSTITVAANNQFYKAEDNVLFNKAGTILLRYPSASTTTQYTIPSSVREIGSDAFSGCSNLQQITLNEGLQKIGKSAFHSSPNLTTLEIPSTVTSIGWRLVRECHSLESVTVASGNTKYMSDNGILYEIDGSGNKIAIVIYPPMKTGTQYSIPDTVKTIEASAFEECKLSEITLGSSIDKICFMAFTNTQDLQSITIPESVTMIEKDAFWHSSIETITFDNKTNWYYTEDGVTTNLTEEDLVASNFTGNDTLPNIYRDTN